MLAEYCNGFLWSLGALSAVGIVILSLCMFTLRVRRWDDRRS